MLRKRIYKIELNNAQCNWTAAARAAPGCSASFDVAVRKALQETVQTMIAGAGQTDDFTRWVDSGSPRKRGQIYFLPYIFLGPNPCGQVLQTPDRKSVV